MAGWFEGYPLAYNRSYTHLWRDFWEILSRKWGRESSFLVIALTAVLASHPDRKERASLIVDCDKIMSLRTSPASWAIWKHSELLFDKKQLIPALQRLLLSYLRAIA